MNQKHGEGSPKTRNLTSVPFKHRVRLGVCHNNPIRLVRQSVKRRTIPAVLSVVDIQKLLSALPFRERTLVLLDAGTGLRMSELFALKWRDNTFRAREINVTRSDRVPNSWAVQDRSINRHRTEPVRNGGDPGT